MSITPFIRSNDNGAAMADYYLAIFPDAKLIARNSFVSTIEIFGSQISILQGGPNTDATLNPSISFSLWIKDLDLTKQLRDKPTIPTYDHGFMYGKDFEYLDGHIW